MKEISGYCRTYRSRVTILMSSTVIRPIQRHKRPNIRSPHTQHVSADSFGHHQAILQYAKYFKAKAFDSHYYSTWNYYCNREGIVKYVKRRCLSVDAIRVAEESHVAVCRKLDIRYTRVTDLWWVFVDQKQVPSMAHDPAVGLPCHQLFHGPNTLCFRVLYLLLSIICGSKATLLHSRCCRG